MALNHATNGSVPGVSASGSVQVTQNTPRARRSFDRNHKPVYSYDTDPGYELVSTGKMFKLPDSITNPTLSPFERVPVEVKANIMDFLTANDQISLGVTSRSCAAAASRVPLQKAFFVLRDENGNEVTEPHPRSVVPKLPALGDEHVELMFRLREGMSAPPRGSGTKGLCQTCWKFYPTDKQYWINRKEEHIRKGEEFRMRESQLYRWVKKSDRNLCPKCAG